MQKAVKRPSGVHSDAVNTAIAHVMQAASRDQLEGQKL